jgi:Cu2+-exporting ATPase
MAPASASDVGQTAADAVFMGDSLAPIATTIMVARRTMRIVRQNFTIAICYNIVAIPLALLGLVTPLVAALAMSGSSIIVVGNALRLRRVPR